MLGLVPVCITLTANDFGMVREVFMNVPTYTCIEQGE